MNDQRRTLPSIDSLLRLPEVAGLAETVPHDVLVTAARQSVESARKSRNGPPSDWAAEILERVAELSRPSLRPCLNATGVVLHTNLGRAPLAAAAIEALTRIGGGYSNLEFDLSTGSRGSRLDHCATLLAERTGAEAAVVVNNAAGALVMALNALAEHREVIISRGELVEIGGSFRIPDILTKSGCTLREVGTTNRTHLRDYQAAISERTGAILVVHRSNFSMTGFVASPDPGEVAALARSRNVPIIHDVGSGLMVDLSPWGLQGEPTVAGAVPYADLVIFSGDKLLGGPQAGCVVGRSAAVAPLKQNPYARAMRADKLTLAALEATLALYRDPERATAEIPVLRMLTEQPKRITERAHRLARQIPGEFGPALEEANSAVGGGSFPDAPLPTTIVTLDPAAPWSPHALALALRLGDPAVVTRVERQRVILDPRTLTDGDVPAVVRALERALAER